MDDGNADFITLDAHEGLNERFNGALYVCLDDEVKFLHFAFLDLFEDVVERYLLYASLFFFLRTGCADFSDVSCLSFIHDIEMVACFRNAVHTEDFNR